MYTIIHEFVTSLSIASGICREYNKKKEMRGSIMKLHRVLLFTSIQMDITAVGEDLHVLLTSDNIPFIGSTVYASHLPCADESEDQSEPQLDISSISRVDEPGALFCEYTARTLAAMTGQNVLCTGGIFTDSPTERDISKLYENIDEMIRDWTVFFIDD